MTRLIRSLAIPMTLVLCTLGCKKTEAPAADTASTMAMDTTQPPMAETAQ
jgi:hypothetical protein